MFLGTHQRTLDDKGRISLPSSFRDKLSEFCIATVMSDQPSLGFYSESAFLETTNKLRADIDAGLKNEDEMRRVAGSAEPLKIDSQGRVTVPAELRSAAGLDKEAVVLGVVDRFEIWSPSAHEHHLGRKS